MPLFYLRKKLKEKQFLKQQQQAMEQWTSEGKPYPPPKLVKQYFIRNIANQFGISSLVETGTYKGHMVYAQFPFFKEIHSIELGIDLFKAAKQKFKDYPNVFLYQGDSGVVLKDVVLKLQEPAVYWLDAHYSEGITARGIQDCPIYSELQTISKQKRKDCILIDDAVDFNGRNGYPTKEELISICVEMFPYHYFEEREGLFYILPR